MSVFLAALVTFIGIFSLLLMVVRLSHLGISAPDVFGVAFSLGVIWFGFGMMWAA